MYQEHITPEEIEALPPGGYEGPIFVIDRLDEQFDRAIRYLSRQRVIGFDTETKPCFTAHQPRNGVALLQLSGGEKAFLFRIKSIGMPKALCDLLRRPDIVKVGAAIGEDVHGLQRYHGFRPHTFVDLQKMVERFGILDKSVKKMSAIILGVRISKAQQLSNWEAETLSEPQQRYAATDAWICREMYLKLKREEKQEEKEEEA